MGRDDIIDLKEAARLAGKAPRTIRRWIQKGLLEDLRATGDTLSPMVVSETAVRAYLSTLSIPGRGGAARGGPPPVKSPPGQDKASTSHGQDMDTHDPIQASPHDHPSQPHPVDTESPMVDRGRLPMDTLWEREEDSLLVRELRERIAILERLTSTVEKERDRLLREVEGLRQDLQESKEAREAVEREMSGTRGGGGVRGLLKAFWPGG